MDLTNLIETRLDLPRLSKDLNELGHPARMWAVRQWTRPVQAKLWDAARGFRAVTLDDYVPADIAPRVEVIHHGVNTLPAHHNFPKRVARPADPDIHDQLVGYNFQSLSGATGPGYYVAHPAAEAGEVDIDYTLVPKEKLDAWPPIVPNSARLGRFVYDGMVDVMRGVSSHVSIGRVRKKSGWQDAWFVLVREDPSPNPQAPYRTPGSPGASTS
jgi:hypothetical protein